MKIDFHNHYYPPEYLAAVKKGPAKVRMDYDAEGNPRLHYPGDYNILVPGHRDLDYREGVLKKHGVPAAQIETALRIAAVVIAASAIARAEAAAA